MARDRDRLAQPGAIALLRLVALEVARVAQRHRDDELGDPRCLLAIDDARDAHVRREVGREQLLDSGGNRADPAQARQPRRQAGRHLPAEDDVDVGEIGVAERRAVLEQLELGRAGADRLDERRGRHRPRDEQDLHRRGGAPPRPRRALIPASLPTP